MNDSKNRMIAFGMILKMYSSETFNEMDEMSRIYNADTPEDLEDAYGDDL